MKRLNIPEDYNIEVSAFDEAYKERIAISTPPTKVKMYLNKAICRERNR
jgi:hypothetical protein